jgi:hypothetical protein
MSLAAQQTPSARASAGQPAVSTFVLAFGAIWQTGSMGATTAATSSTAVARVASTTPAAATTTATTLAAVTSSQS